MKPEVKKKLQNAPFVVDWDAGERYYQIHIFEDADGLNWIQISSKTDKDGKIEMFSRASKNSARFNAKVNPPGTEEEFNEMIGQLDAGLSKVGFVHRFVDLRSCYTPKEAISLIKKTDSRFKSNSWKVANQKR